MCCHVQEYIKAESFPQSSVDLILIDFSYWGAMRTKFCCQKIPYVDHLNCILLHFWVH